MGRMTSGQMDVYRLIGLIRHTDAAETPIILCRTDEHSKHVLPQLSTITNHYLEGSHPEGGQKVDRCVSEMSGRLPHELHTTVRAGDRGGGNCTRGPANSTMSRSVS